MHRAGLIVVNSTVPEADGLAVVPALLLTSCGTSGNFLHPFCLHFLLLSKADNNSNITHHSQEVETSQGSAGGCTDKQNVTDPSNRDHLDLKRQEIVTCATARTNPV